MAERVVEVRLSAQVQQYLKGIEDAAAATEKLQKEAAKVAERNKAYQDLGRTAAGIGGSMAALALAVAKTGIEYNSLQQKSRAAMTTMLGSAEKANEQMDRLDAFARTSPFSKSVFISAQQQMIAFGIEAKRVIPYLEAIQDAVAAAGGSNEDIAGLAEIFGKISSTSKITAVDLMQFGNRGVDAAQLIGTSMNKSAGQIRADITAGTLDAGVALDALAAGMQNRFAGAAANVKMTFEGATDRVRAAWRDVSSELMKPLVDPNGGGALVDFLNWIADLMRAFQSLPDPIKFTVAAMFGLVGVVTLLGGTFLLARPKVLALKGALETVGVSMKAVGWAGGGLTAALTVLTAVVGIVAGAQAAAREKARAYAEAMKQGEDAVREAAVAQLVLKDSVLGVDFDSAADRAEKLGISTKTLTDAFLGNADAMSTVGDALDIALLGRGAEAEAMADKLGLSMGEMRAVAEALNRELGVQADAFEAAKEQTKQTDEAMGSAAGSTGEVARSADDAAKALDTMGEALKNVGREAWTMGEAADKAQGAINKMGDAASKEEASLYGLNDESIKLRDSMRDVEQAHRDSAEAILRTGGSLYEAKLEWQKGRETVIKQREAMEESRVEAERWADVNLGSAAKVEAALKDFYEEVKRQPDRKVLSIEANTTPAQNALDRLVRTYNGTTLRMNVATDSFYKPNATGNVYDGKVKAFAAGGVEPGIYPYTPGGLHKFAEEYSEAYMSMDPARKPQSRRVWVESGRRLGFFGEESSGGGGIRPGDRVVFEVEGQPLTAVARRVVRDSVPSAGAVMSEFGR